MDSRSEAERIAALDDEGRNSWFKANQKKLIKLEHDWPFWERPDQRAPEGDWHIWLAMAGRGFGKTRMGAEWVRAKAEAKGDLRIALVGATLSEVRAVMVEGESGILRVSPNPPNYEPSLKQITWPNGTIAQLYSAAEPDSLRGGGHDFAWADEMGKWDKGEAAWDNLMFTLRRGKMPRAMVTTTPRSMPLLRRLLREKGVVRTGGSSFANRRNLASRYFDSVIARYQGTRLGRQELDGELIDDIEGAIWDRAWIEDARVITRQNCAAW
jgi:phage terminase large subunit-like protein